MKVSYGHTGLLYIIYCKFFNTSSCELPANIQFSQFDFSTDLFIEAGKLVLSDASDSIKFDIFGTLGDHVSGRPEGGRVNLICHDRLSRIKVMLPKTQHRDILYHAAPLLLIH